MTCQSAGLMHGLLGTLGAASQALGTIVLLVLLHRLYMRSASNAILTPGIWGTLQGMPPQNFFCLTNKPAKKKRLVATQLACVVGEPRL